MAPAASISARPAEARLVVVAQAAPVVEQDVRELRALLADLEHLVDLLLVLDHREAHLALLIGNTHSGRRGVLVERDRNGAERLRRQHGGVQAGPVGADDDQVLAALQAELVQAARDMRYPLGHLAPADGLPDAVLFSRIAGASRGAWRRLRAAAIAWEGGPHGVSSCNPAGRAGLSPLIQI